MRGEQRHRPRAKTIDLQFIRRKPALPLGALERCQLGFEHFQIVRSGALAGNGVMHSIPEQRGDFVIFHLCRRAQRILRRVWIDDLHR